MIFASSSRSFPFCLFSSSSASCGADERRRRNIKNELCRPCFNKTNVESSSMRRTRAKARRDENEEDFEDVPSSFSFMVSSGDNNNNNNNNNNRRMNRKERRRLLGERKKQTSENEEEEDDKDDESNKVKEDD